MNNDIIEHNLAEHKALILRQAMEALNRIAPLEYAIEPVYVIPDHKYDCVVRVKVFGKEFVWCVDVTKASSHGHADSCFFVTLLHQAHQNQPQD